MPNTHLFFLLKLQPYLYQKWVRKKNNDPSKTLDKKATILETDRCFFSCRMPRLARWSYVWSGREIWHLKWRLPRMGYVHGLTGERKPRGMWVNLLNVFFSALLDEFDEWTLREHIKWVSEMNSTNMYIYIFIYIHRYTYTDIHIYSYVHTHTHLYIYTYTHIRIYIYTYAYVRHIHVCLYIYIHRYTYT